MQITAPHPPRFDPTDTPLPGMFARLFQGLEANSRHLIGPLQARLLTIPYLDDAGEVVGGFWGTTLYEWLHVQMLLVPEACRKRRIGSAMMDAAETEARARGCRGAHVDTFSFQAADFYRKRGYAWYGELADFPPGHSRIFLAKRFDACAASAI